MHREFGLHPVRLVGSWLLGIVVLQPITAGAQNATTPAVPGTISTFTSDIVTLRADHRIDLTRQWAVGLRADLPFLAKDPISSDNPSRNYLYGVGDADFQAALLHEFNSRWAARRSRRYRKT